MEETMEYKKNDPLAPVLAVLKREAFEVCATRDGIWVGKDHWITRDKDGLPVIQHWHAVKTLERLRIEAVLRIASIEFLRGEDYELPGEACATEVSEKPTPTRETSHGRRGGAKRKARTNALDAAYAVLSEHYPERVLRRRDTVWIDKQAYIKRLPGKPKLLVQFNSACQESWCEECLGHLRTAGVEWTVGRPYELEGEDPVVLDQETEDIRWLGRLGRDKHVRSCLQCKALLDQVAVAEEEYAVEVKKSIKDHAKAVPAGTAGVPPCAYSGCVHHELNVPRDLAKAMIKIGRGDRPWEDVRGIKVSNIALAVTEKDHPEGFDMKRQDAVRRRFTRLKDSAGDIYVRMGPKTTSLHVWIDPPYPSRREDAEDVATIEDVIAQHKNIDALRTWVMRKFHELRGLAEMELEFQK